MIGQRFGLVTVLAREGYARRGNPVWFAVCDCGKARWFQTSNLQKRPPKTHRFCFRGVPAEQGKFTLELGLDSPRTGTYGGAT
jgi:hypothetical protein